eukprot:12465321-Alexandrium_andersonii.AAC.1
MIGFLEQWQQGNGRAPRRGRSPVRGRSPLRQLPPSALRTHDNAQNVAAGAASSSDLQLQLASLVNGNANKNDLIAGIKG